MIVSFMKGMQLAFCWFLITTAYKPFISGSGRSKRQFSKLQSSRPVHIIMVVIDDLGIADTSIQVPNATIISQNTTTPITPNLQAVRNEGILVNDHTVFKFCSPSRSQFLTGRYAYHLGQQTYNNLSPEGARCGLNTSYQFLPNLLQSAGYWNVGLGKWHQGFAAPEYLPTARGFNRFVGFYAGGQTHFTHVASYHMLENLPEWWTPKDNATLPNPDGCTSLWDLHNDSSVSGTSAPSFAVQMNGTYSAYITTTAFMDALREYKDVAAPHGSPLFAYIAYHGVHLPLQVPEEYLAKYYVNTSKSGMKSDLPFEGDTDRLKLAAMVTAVDESIGNITAALKAAGMWNDTLLLITTDNGAPICAHNIPAAELCNKSCGGSNGLLRGSKMTDWQGGVRGLTILGYVFNR